MDEKVERGKGEGVPCVNGVERPGEGNDWMDGEGEGSWTLCKGNGCGNAGACTEDEMGKGKDPEGKEGLPSIPDIPTPFECGGADPWGEA